MNTRLKSYVAVVVAAALCLIAVLDWGRLVDLTPRDWMGLATFLLLAALSQAVAVDSVVGAAKPVKSSITFLPLLALAVVMPPAAVVFATGSVTAVHEIFFRERDWFRGIFNTAQTILAYGIAALVFGWISTVSGYDLRLTSAMEIEWVFLPFYGLAISFFLLNLLFVGTYIALRQSERLSAVLVEATGKGGGNLFYDLLASPIALFAAYFYSSFYIGGLLGIVLPLLLIRHSYLSAIQLQQANRDLLRVLVKAIETRDPYTSGHSLRVATLAKMIAEDYGLRSAVVADVETAALLHDIGKIDALYAEIISKAANLTDEERAIIRTHATKGADLLRSLTSLSKNVIAGVRHHHERYDGAGYPDHMQGKAIPIAARIIMICDSIDAMLSDRPYRRALPLSKVRDELRRCSGTQFDPDIVRAILEHGTLERADLLVERSGARAAPVKAVAG